MPNRPGRPSLSPEQTERFRELLRAALKKFDGNQTALANAMKLTPSAVNQLFKRNSPAYGSVAKLTKLMDVTVDSVLDPRGSSGAPKRGAPNLPNGLAQFLSTVERGKYSDDELADAAGFRDREGQDLAPDLWGEYLELTRRVRAQVSAKQALRAAGVEPSPQAKSTIETRGDDPIEEMKTKRMKKRSAPARRVLHSDK